MAWHRNEVRYATKTLWSIPEEWWELYDAVDPMPLTIVRVREDYPRDVPQPGQDEAYSWYHFRFVMGDDEDYATISESEYDESLQMDGESLSAEDEARYRPLIAAWWAARKAVPRD